MNKNVLEFTYNKQKDEFYFDVHKFDIQSFKVREEEN